jgi:hypothetical protein
LLRENRELRGRVTPGVVPRVSDAEEKAIQGLERLMHRPAGALKATPGITAGQTADDARMVERVVRAYRAAAGPAAAGPAAAGLAAAPAAVAPSAIWKGIHDTRQRPLHDLILHADVETIGALLRRPGDSDLFWGFDGLVRENVERYNTSSAVSMAVARLCQDHLLRVAEVIGAVRMENPESPSPVSPGLQPADDLLTAIEQVAGHDIRFPDPFPDEIGVQTRAGVASYRAIHALYQAWRISGLVQGIPQPSVLELGGGLGRTAYYAHQFGVTDYTIIDLPFTGFAQGYFLMRTMGEAQVVLQGEEGDGDPGKVKVLDPGSFLESSKRYDLVLNVDSLTEMDRATADRYWKRIQTATPLFLSINHERNPFTVKEVVDADPSRIAHVHRYPYGPRRGYVEEIVHLRS